MENFVIKLDLNSSSVETVVAIKLDNRMYNVLEVLATSGEDFDDVLLSSAEGYDHPFLICTDLGINVTQLYSIFKKLEFKAQDDFLIKVMDTLSKNNLNLTLEDLKNLELCCSEFDKYLNGKKVKINFLNSKFDNYALTDKLVKENNSSGEAKTIYIEGENKTIFRATPDDELFIRVPSYEDLFEGLVTIDPKEICKPYPSPEFRTRGFRNFLEQYSVKLEDVVGLSQNNDLEILPTEERFKSALTSLMEAGTLKEYPNNTIEECKEQNIGSTLVLGYLKDLAMCAVSLNWQHSGYIPSGYDYDEDSDYDDDNDDSKSSKLSDTSVLGNKMWSAVGMESANGRYDESIDLFDGSAIILDILDDQFNKDVYGVIDVVIRMFRFGKYKPNRIKLGEGDYFDLTTFTAYKMSGNYSSTDFVVDEEGNNLFVLGAVKMSDTMTDTRYIKSNNIKRPSIDLQIGLICERRFIGDSFTQKVIVSFIDLIKAYDLGESICKVRGVSLIDGKFVISEEVEEVLSETQLNISDLAGAVINKPEEYIYFTYNDFKDPFVEKLVWDKSISVCSLIDKYYSSKDLILLAACDYSSLEELDDICVRFQIPPRACIEMNIANYLIPIFCDVSYSLEQGALKDDNVNSSYTINLFKHVMKTRGFSGNFRPEVVKSLQSSIKDSTTFTRNSNKTIDDNGDDFLKNVIDSDKDNLAYAKLILPKTFIEPVKAQFKSMIVTEVDSSTDDAVVGYVGQRQLQNGSVRIFIHPNNVPTNVPYSVNILKTCPALMGILAKSLQSSEPANKFESIEAGVYYSKLGNAIYNVLVSRVGD